jgi:GMP synthase (glutamine-hydrolysing)
VGGGPFNSSDAPLEKSAVQHRVERELGLLLDEVVERDFPFFGACYGVGTLGVHQGGVIDRTYAEPISAVRVRLTEEGAADPVLAGMAGEFDAFVGHKEACRTLPPSAVLLASSPACPVQMFRVKRNVYATQFHPELDLAGIIARTEAYRHFGYFEPHEADAVVDRSRDALITEPPRVLARFVELYAR